MNKIILILFFLFPFSIANAIEVGGHITENTTWSPYNNPYLVTEILYVDAGVTLTILPGTEVKISGASCTSWQEFDQNFWLYGGVSIAKFIQVDGRIIAEGTEQDSIIFTRMQDDPDYYWGTIYITEQAEMCRFKHCKVEYSAGIGIALSNISNGAVSIYNGEGIIKKCLFINNGSCIVTYHNLVKYLEISKNIFTYDNNINNFVENIWISALSISKPAEGHKPAFITDNKFLNNCHISSSNLYFIKNINSSSDMHTGLSNKSSYFYDNSFTDCQKAIYGGHDGDSLFIKKNNFIDGSYGVDIDYAYVEISDNYFEECKLFAGFNTYGLICNNNALKGSIYGAGAVDFFNNISFKNGNGAGISATCKRVSCTNNISTNNLYAFEACESFDNCILIGNEELEQFSVTGTPIFRNCIIDFPLEYPLIDGGGNIIVDSIQAQQIFEDIENGDFHLTEGSIAIDAGFDTLGYYYPFDMEYHTRVWDGNGDGIAIIDIGAYEYGAPSLGGIEGYTYNPISGDRVDYVFIKINNEPGEFTFSDSIGNFEFKLPAGTYDVYAERVFYDDVIEYNIEVVDGQFTQVAIPMTETYDVDEHDLPHAGSGFIISAHPNPFSTSTTISYTGKQ
nr:carboxypeptidase regulatory-like domain-containing protein [Candidatus Cloacimonadota bacterium]